MSQLAITGLAIIVALAITAATIILAIPDTLICNQGTVGKTVRYTIDGIIGLFALGMWIGIIKRLK